MKSIITITMLFALIVPAFSPSLFKTESALRLAPRMLNYQGFLTDTLGNPVSNPSMNMTFRIYDASSSGSLLWTESQNVTVNKGIFSAVLGAITPVPDSIFVKYANSWLELTVIGQVLSPRTRIAAAGYALNAANADTAQYARAALPVGPAGNDLGGSYPNPIVTGLWGRNISSVPPGNGEALVWNGTAWQPSVSSDADWIISGSDMYAGIPGNVGIGTSTPLATLDVFGNICGGISNTSVGTYGSILGGYGNHAGNAVTDSFNFVGAGYLNTAGGQATAVIGGYENGTMGRGSFVGAGTRDTASGWYSMVGGGSYNKATNSNATVAGGYANRASGDCSAVAGGSWNCAIGSNSFVGGGWTDTARGGYSAVLGGANNHTEATCAIAAGWFNTVNAFCGGALSGFNNLAGDEAIDTAAVIGGGWANIATAKVATIAGGHMNVATGAGSSIGGGSRDTASGYCAAISGGVFNRAKGDYSLVGGGLNNLAQNPYSTVAGGQDNAAAAKWSFVGGGRYNVADDTMSFIGGGYGNDAYAPMAVIGGGYCNSVYYSGDYSVVGGGYYNNAHQPFCGVLSGYANDAGQYLGDTADVVCGGSHNLAMNGYATVGGGYLDTADAYGATVPGGYRNTASGACSFAAGRRAKALNPNTFVWADGSSINAFTSTGVDQFLIRAAGGVGINTNAPWAMLSVAGSANLNQGVLSGPALWVNSAEAIWFDGTYFSWGFGGVANYFADDVGIGVTSPGYRLDVAGACHASSFPTSSDIRLKKNIKPLTNALEKIMKLRGVSFDWNETYEKLGRSTHHREIGVIAQDVEAVFPELVSKWGDEQYRGVDYGRLTAALIEAVKELKSENDDLRARIDALEKR